MPQNKRNTYDELVAHLARAARQGQSLIAYARDHELDVQRLYNARWEQKARGEGSAKFVRVAIKEPTAPAVPTAVAIQLPNGISITAPMTTTLIDLVRTLLPL